MIEIGDVEFCFILLIVLTSSYFVSFDAVALEGYLEIGLTHPQSWWSEFGMENYFVSSAYQFLSLQREKLPYSPEENSVENCCRKSNEIRLQYFNMITPDVKKLCPKFGMWNFASSSLKSRPFLIFVFGWYITSSRECTSKKRV